MPIPKKDLYFLLLQVFQAPVDVLNFLHPHPAPIWFAQFIAADYFQEFH
jgi:hypothetical protein